MTKIKYWLMLRYCPDFLRDMPTFDNSIEYDCVSIVVYGYWGNKSFEATTKRVIGIKKAYVTARWLALKEQWKRPTWLYNCGINYGIRKVNDDKQS